MITYSDCDSVANLQTLTQKHPIYVNLHPHIINRVEKLISKILNIFNLYNIYINSLILLKRIYLDMFHYR